MRTFTWLLLAVLTAGFALRAANLAATSSSPFCTRPVIDGQAYDEWALAIKSRRDLFPAVQKELEKLHKYEVPEILAVPVVEGSAPYLAWMDGELRVEAAADAGTDALPRDRGL